MVVSDKIKSKISKNTKKGMSKPHVRIILKISHENQIPCYWHSNKDEDSIRNNDIKLFGFETLSVNEEDLKDIDTLLNRLDSFTTLLKSSKAKEYGRDV